MKKTLKGYYVIVILLSFVNAQDFTIIDKRLTSFEFDQALKPLEKLYRKYPQNIDVLLRLSITHHYLSEASIKKSEDKKNAIKAFQYINKAYDIDSNDANILKWYVIAIGKTVEQESIKQQIEQSKNIEQIALKVIKLLPNDEYCYNIMGQWHYRLASLGRASRKIASILFSDPPQGSYENARYFLEKSLQLNAEYIGTYYWLGKTYLKLNESEKAYELFAKGILLETPFKREEKLFNDMTLLLKKRN